jgi:hypothetical protein
VERTNIPVINNASHDGKHVVFNIQRNWFFYPKVSKKTSIIETHPDSVATMYSSFAKDNENRTILEKTFCTQSNIQQFADRSTSIAVNQRTK